MKVPSTKADLQFFVDNSIPEGPQLEYKDSRKMDPKNAGEIAKEVSAFANSDGGLLIFGIQERGHLPVAVDGGTDHSRYTREWLENVILSNIAPRPADLEVKQIQLSQTHSAYAVRVERSVRGPHQER
jgi:predicted HTH transcriptional regulator